MNPFSHTPAPDAIVMTFESHVIGSHQGVHAPIPLQTSLRYTREAPFEVEMVFLDAQGGVVPWRFSRDLLVDGLVRPVGEGDVRIDGTSSLGPTPALLLEVRNHDTFARMLMPRAVVEHFVAGASQVVPIGAETVPNLDEELAELLSEF